ncbi:MAG TPA: PAS domain S-box protein [Thermoanaerobaculia bacterium]
MTSSNEEFALLVDSVQDYAIFMLSPEGEIRSWNRGAARIMGYDAHEIVGQHFSRFYTEDDLAARKPWRELEIAAAEGRVEDEGWRIRKDGRRFWCNTVITALRSDSAELIGFAKVTRDLTERRNADELIRHSEEALRLLVQSVQEYAIFMLDPDGVVSTWNAGAHRIKGYTADEIIGRHFSTFYREDDLAAAKPERILEIARETGHVEDEGWRLRKDGSQFWANVVITSVFDDTGVLRGFAKVTRDMTERKHADEVRQSLLEQREARLQAEEEQRVTEAAYRAALETNRAKDEFLMTLSHELRTPITAILGWARLLPTVPSGSPMFADAVDAIGRSARLQAHLIDDVLDVSRIVAGKLRLSRETLDTAQLILGAIDAVHPTADARDISVTTDMSPDLGAIVADPTRMHQVLWNLLTNALKFTPKGGQVVVRARLVESSLLEIAIRDTGEGIDPAFLPHVFEAFRQEEGTLTRTHGGLGLGLSIVRYLVEAHGGSVRAESPGRNQGSTFTISLPVAGVQPESGARTTEPAAGDTTPLLLAGVQILIVDDDRDTREVIRAILRRAGAEVTAADSAAAALEHIRASKPDLLLTDIAMPSMDGYQLVREVRSLDIGSSLKIAALTAFPEGAGAAKQVGFDAYLRKPIDPAELIESLARVLG